MPSHTLDAPRERANRSHEETFHPHEPIDLASTGLSESAIDTLILKHLFAAHSTTGRAIANLTGLPFSIIDKRIASLKTRRFLTSTDVSSFGDFTVQLVEEGHRQAMRAMEVCSYVGPAPVTFEEYAESVWAQSLRKQPAARGQIGNSFASISMSSSLLARLGPAIRAGSGLFLYGPPGNGKTTIAESIGKSYGSTIWIPQVIEVGGQIVKLFDVAHHIPVPTESSSSILRNQGYDQRWVRVQRPTVVAGGELTLDSLEIRHDPTSKISEAPLQMKANGGVLVIDDFGRQRVSPVDLLNRWIVPLDRKYDLLGLHTGKKFQVPFEMLVVFSTNLDPSDLVDEAFLRRIPYKILVSDPSEEEYRSIFRKVADGMKLEYDETTLDHLLNRHYRSANRPRRRCHPRDLILQVRSHCDYNELPFVLTRNILDQVTSNYFLSGPGVALQADS